MPENPAPTKVSDRAAVILKEQELANDRRVDKIMFFLMAAQWLFAVALAYLITPLTWSGGQSHPHPHLLLAAVWGGVFTIVSGVFYFTLSGSAITRQVMATMQMAMGALLIAVTGGRIETHFHVFGSLAILAFYRDIRVLITATVVTAAYHFAGILWFTESLYGVASASIFRALEHAGWVVFEDVFLLMNILQNNGDIRLNSQRQAELEEASDLTRTLNELAQAKQHLTSQAKEVAKVVDYIHSAGSSIAASLAELVGNTHQTLSAVTETTSIAEQVRQTAELSSRKARQVADEAHTVLKISEAGQAASAETVTGMNNIREQMSGIGQSMSNLSAKTQQIGEIIEAVDDLAQQSNLLSVNAAIEAAKAGDYGKGFSVVAQEVKSLSAESKEATAKVRKILQDVVNATVSATMSADLGIKAVASGEEVVKQSRDAIVALTRSLGQAAQASSQIESSSQQQLAGMQQVVMAMISVQESSNQNVKSVSELSESINQLNSLGLQLRQLVEYTQELDHSS